jgi:hypothetical protein
MTRRRRSVGSTSTPAQPAAAPAPALTPELLDSEAAYQRVLARAQAVSAEDLAVLGRFVPALMMSNFALAVTSAATDAAAAARTFFSLDLAYVSDLAPALRWASSVYDTALAPTLAGEIANAAPMRSRLMATLATLTAEGYFEQHDYDAIAKGRGSRDMAEDLVAGARLMRSQHDAIAGKHPLTDDFIAQCASVGESLLARMGTKRARVRLTPEQTHAKDVRDRIAVLIVQAYPQLWRVVAAVSGPALIDARAPSLLATIGHKRGTAATTPATTTPASPSTTTTTTTSPAGHTTTTTTTSHDSGHNGAPVNGSAAPTNGASPPVPVMNILTP